ncbi:MAG: hypothetical protein KatS3mg124_1405 [Porticoccaceae bacterium]|nr:MAG: hypothetical protein KatS3mg124_1405 [Porticoccaceae bacterium]
MAKDQENHGVGNSAENPEQAAPAGEAAAPEPSTAPAAGQDAEALAREVAALREELLRAHADMQNVRRRAERDAEQARRYALEKFAAELLAVVDNLERAVAAIDADGNEFGAVAEGVRLTLKSFLDVLARHHIEPIDPRGAPFDPERHQAMTVVPRDDVPPNTVLDVYQKGYLLNGRLLRPALVAVAQAPEGRGGAAEGS